MLTPQELSNLDFQRKLAIGTAGEDLVHEWLKKNNSYVQDNRHQKYDKNYGPRLRGTEGTVVVPDFVVLNKSPLKSNFAVDVKVKNSVYTINGIKYFTMDGKFLDYKRYTELFKLDKLKIAFVYDSRIYMYDAEDCVDTHWFNNEYGGLGYLFQYDTDRISY